jgi:phage host-nuclease inhibitor protein Gam
MPKKQKTDPSQLPVPQDDQAAIAQIVEIGETERLIGKMQADADAVVQAAAQKLAASIAPMQKRYDDLVSGLRVFCEANRLRLTDGGKTKTVELATGKVEWRHRPPKVSIRGKVEDLIERIQEKASLAKKFLRPSVELDKQAMLKEPELARSLQGVTIKSAGEDFYVTPISAPLSEEAA